MAAAATPDVLVRLAGPDDLAGMAEVYMAAFPESMRHFFGDEPLPPAALADVLGFVLEAEPEAVRVAEVAGTIAGYCLSPSQFSRVGRVASRPQNLWRWVRNWLAGRYRLPLSALRLLVKNKVSGWREARRDPYHCEAKILSIAVRPEFQGQGLGKRLLLAGLEYLQGTGVPQVRLEVRPENTPALKLYESQGFVTVGRTRDSQGDWLIMLKDFAGAPPG
jgi:[ribosomal protein S18]-alanine N-acetyltransferase